MPIGAARATRHEPLERLLGLADGLEGAAAVDRREALQPGHHVGGNGGGRRSARAGPGPGAAGRAAGGDTRPRRSADRAAAPARATRPARGRSACRSAPGPRPAASRCATRATADAAAAAGGRGPAPARARPSTTRPVAVRTRRSGAERAMGDVARVVEHGQRAEHLAGDLQAGAWVERDQAVAGHLEHLDQPGAGHVAGHEDRARGPCGLVSRPRIRANLTCCSLARRVTRSRSGISTPANAGIEVEPLDDLAGARVAPFAHTEAVAKDHPFFRRFREVCYFHRARPFRVVESRSDHTHRPTGLCNGHTRPPRRVDPCQALVQWAVVSIGIASGCAPSGRDRTQPCKRATHFVIG